MLRLVYNQTEKTCDRRFKPIQLLKSTLIFNTIEMTVLFSKQFYNESLTKFYDSDPFLSRLRNILVKNANHFPRVNSVGTWFAIVMWLVKHA